MFGVGSLHRGAQIGSQMDARTALALEDCGVLSTCPSLFCTTTLLLCSNRYIRHTAGSIYNIPPTQQGVLHTMADPIRTICPPMGDPIPPGGHSVVVSLPTWKDTLGYKLHDAETESRMQNGYPRFFMPKIVRRVSESSLRQKKRN